MSSVWADVWNPDVNEWSPSDDPEGTYGQAEPSHFDVAAATPMEPGEQSAALNVLTNVRTAGVGPQSPPTPTVNHEVHTYETGAEAIHMRTVAVVGNVVPTRLLDPNDDRRRALIKVITSASVIVINGINDGGNQQLTGPPAQSLAQWAQATGDPMLEVKATGGIEAYGTSATGTVFVSIWEELNAVAPGVGV
jgi:hypothetical protein